MGLLFRLILFFLVAFWGSFTVVLVALNLLLHPLSFFHRKKREVQPEILQDSTYGTHKYITANGIKFHYVANGTEGKPLMLFIHGFPEFWFSWRFQLLNFCNDYYAVAVDLRGYGDTEKPAHKRDYKIEDLTQDIAELIPALGYKSCVLVAHDWGGILAWQLTQSRPDLVNHLIMMNSTSYSVYMKLVFSNLKQFLMSWYIFMLQLPYLPEIMMRAEDYKSLEQAFFSKSTGMKNQQNVPKEVIEAFKYSFSQKGVCTAGVNYYRNLFNTENHCLDRKVDVPVLFIWGDEDIALNKELPDKHGVMATNLSVKHIPNCSHWTQQDCPDLVNQYMQEFLQKQNVEFSST